MKASRRPRTSTAVYNRLPVTIVKLFLKNNAPAQHKHPLLFAEKSTIIKLQKDRMGRANDNLLYLLMLGLFGVSQAIVEK
jgi:hypothetical protein